MRKLVSGLRLGFVLLCGQISFGVHLAYAEKALPVDDDFDLMAITVDNDLFVGNDDGYTNGFYLTLLDRSDESGYIPDADFWVAPLGWSLPMADVRRAVNVYSVGQTMLSPSDITIAVPPETELPYSALLAASNTYIVADDKIADRVSTTLGIVGPWAMGEQTQKAVHSVIGADEPQGWDTQLENELVFQLLRSRAWRAVSFYNDKVDVISSAELTAGTISSAADLAVTLRFGEGLLRSFPSTLLSSARLSNPIASDHGWFFYLGMNAGYSFNQIFTDGNTYRNSRSIPYKHEYVGVSTGLSFATRSWAFTFAFADSNLIGNEQDQEALENLTRFGTMTLAWRI